MRVLKTLFVFLVLLPLACFSHTIEKPQLIIQINSETLALDHTNIKHAYLEKENDREGYYDLSIELSAQAAKRLNDLSTANIGKTMYLYFGKNKLISKSTIQTPLGPNMLISTFPQKEAKKLINSLQSNSSNKKQFR